MHSVQKAGFFCFLQAGEILALRWDKQNEEAVISDLEDHEALLMKVDQFDSRLAPYPIKPESCYERWKALNSFVTMKDLARFLPYKLHAITSMSESNLDDSGLLVREGRHHVLHWTTFDLKRSFSPDALGSERSKYSQDKSWLLRSVLERLDDDYKKLLAEFQFSFICLLFAQNFEGFEQWKRLFHLIAWSIEVIGDETHNEFLCEWLDVLAVQLKEIPKDFFEDLISAQNFIKPCLVRFCVSVLDSGNKTLSTKLAKLTQTTESLFHWSPLLDAQAELQVLNEEDEPTIVYT